MAKTKSLQTPASENQVVDQVIEIIRFMGDNRLAEIDLETSEMKLSLKKHASVQYQTVQSFPSAPVMPVVPSAGSTDSAKNKETQTAAAKETPAAKHNYQTVNSPMTGTFYRAPSPTSDPFAKEGDTVKAGQTICIVEAMKMMNEIKSDKAGRLVKFLIENGKPVEKGTALIHIEA
jgi:acetyl-CoA carboxylase biotin carboxyl carrier protein